MSAVATPIAPATPAPAPTDSPPPKPVLWTVPEFHRINESGVFGNRRPILLDGVILELGPMNPPHAIAVELVDTALRAAFGPGWRLRVQLPLALGTDSDSMPDVAVVAGSPRDVLAHPTTAALVVEVADTSLAIDITRKAEKYAAANVPDYWVLDLAARRLLVFRDPAPVAAGGAAYRTHLTLGAAESVTPLAAPSGVIPVADLLP